MTDTAQALFYVAPGRAELREVALPPLAPGWVEVETTCSALSRGTERLVLEGRVPETEWPRMRAPHQEGDFPFPVKYGYAAVGRVAAGPEALVGRAVFALHPHQTRFRLPASAVTPLPEDVPPGRGVLAANAETALNAIWDAELRPGSRVAIVGAGLLGCLVAGLLAERSDLAVTLCDVIAARAEIASDFRVTFCPPEALADDHDTVFHTSATAAGLDTALACLGFEGQAVELSWYGDARAPVALGGAFHSRRLRILSSQVGHVAAPRRASTSRAERLAAALAALADPRFDRLVTAEVSFAELPDRIPGLLAPGADGIATRIRYE